MVVIGSSTIRPPGVISGFSGPTGPSGPVGPRGASGPTGPTGATGATGRYIFDATNITDSNENQEYLRIIMSDGTFYDIPHNDIRGATGSAGDLVGITVGTGDRSPFKTVEGVSFIFRGLSAYGSVQVIESDDGKTIGISADTTPVGITFQAGDGFYVNASGKVAGTVFLKTENKARSHDDNSALVFRSESAQVGDFQVGGLVSDTPVVGDKGAYMGATGIFNTDSPITFIRSIQPNETVGITGSYLPSPVLAPAGQGIFLDVRYSSVFEIETPIGITGFTGDFVSGE